MLYLLPVVPTRIEMRANMEVYSSLKIFSIRVEVLKISRDVYKWQIVELGTETVSYLHKHRYSNPAIAMRDCLHVVCGEPDRYRKAELRQAVESNPCLNW